MGQRHREERKRVKRSFRQLGLAETEFGELRVRMTKAEVRRRVLRRVEESRAMRLQMEREILELAARRATEDVQAAMDAEVFGELIRASNQTHATT